METLVEKGDVEVHNVAIFQNGLVGNSVTHGFVDRGTNGFGEVVVVEWRRVRASLDGFLVNDGVQLDVYKRQLLEHIYGMASNKTAVYCMLYTKAIRLLQ